MSGLPVRSQTEIPKVLVTPRVSGVLTPSVVAAASLAAGAVGTMDTAPTEAEVVALQRRFDFDAADNVRAVRLEFVSGKPDSCSALCLLAVVNAMSDNDAAASLAGYRARVVYPNVPVVITSPDAITSVHVVAVPSGITSANYEGQRLIVTGVQA